MWQNELFIEGNNILNNEGSGVFINSSEGSGSVNIEDNLSKNNITDNVATSGDVFHLFYSTSYDMSFSINDNLIDNNSAAAGPIINISSDKKLIASSKLVIK